MFVPINELGSNSFVAAFAIISASANAVTSEFDAALLI